MTVSPAFWSKMSRGRWARRAWLAIWIDDLPGGGRESVQRLSHGRRVFGCVSTACGYDICASTCWTGTVATLMP